MRSRVWSLLPVRCVLCQAWAGQGLCSACLQQQAPRPERPRCPGCGVRLALGVLRCAGCEREPPPHGPVQVAVDYEHPWDRVMMQFKFGGHPEWAHALAGLMANSLATADGPKPDCIVPVPLSPERLARRGYNQAWELTRRLGRRLGLPARADVLARAVDLPGQAEQDRAARLHRLRGVFQVSTQGRPWVVGRRVALVDDVFTTGATAAEAARTLLAAGASEVVVWAFARTPPPPDGPS